MTLERMFELFGNDKDHRPNKFTIYLGEIIRKAREEKGLSQEELAKKIYKRRATLSSIENGKSEPDASTLVLLAHSLDKPLGYFYPSYLYKEIKQEALAPLENELLIHFRKIWSDDLKKAAIIQVKALAKFDPVQTLMDVQDIALSEKEREAQIKEYIEKIRRRPKKK